MDEQQQRIMYKRSRALREYVASLHLFTMFIGLAVTSIGAYLINSNMSRTVSIFLLVIGVMITTIGFIGCFGAHLEHTSFLNTYSSITAIALILELVLMGLVYSHQPQLDEYGSIIWDFFYEQDPQFLLDLEKTAKCCGYASIGDRSIPKTCSILLGVNIGCRESMITNIKQQHQCITISILFLLSVQLIALLLSVILSFIIDRETIEEETYMALLLSSSANEPSSSSSFSSSPGYNHSFGRQQRPVYFNNYTRRTSNNSLIPKYGSTPSTTKN